MLNAVFGLTFILFSFKECNKPAFKDELLTDTTSIGKLYRFQDSINDHNAIKELMWSDSIDKLKERLKTPLLKWKYVFAEIHDTINGSEKPKSSNKCCDKIEFANVLITQQDSLISVYGFGLAACLNEKETLKAQLKFNREFVKPNDCPVYKKLIWKVYIKK